MDTAPLNEWLTAADIEHPLRRMNGRDVRLSGQWACEQFKASMGENLGVWRISGMMNTPSGEEPWSLVLKGWDCANRSGDPSSFNWPWREADLYRSGVLDDLPGIAAPACHGVVEHEDRVWVWLDDLTVHPKPEWTVERFAAAARSLGRFNGAYLAGRPVPGHPGLSRRWIEGWVHTRPDIVALLETHGAHPRMRVVAPPDVAASLARIWKGRTRVLSHLRSLPQGFAHLDAFAQNIFFRPHPGVGDETVLIDWSFAGLAAPGEELASLCFASLGFAPSLLAIIDDVEAAIVPAYVQGLRDAGWICDEAEIWHAYRSTVTLRYVAAAPSVAQWAMESGDAQEAIAGALGVADGDLFEHLAACARWIAARADST